MFPFLEAFLAFSFAETFFFRYVDLRQLRHLAKSSLPPTLVGSVTETEFKKSNNYTSDKIKFSAVVSSFELFLSAGLWLGGFYPWLYHQGIRTSNALGFTSDYVVALAFGILMVPLQLITSIPVSLYSDFVIEERYGFNKKTLKLFIMDELKSLMLMAILAPPILYAVLFVIAWGGKNFYLYLWLFSITLSLVMMWIFPIFIQPLFNKYETLKDEELRVKIESLARHVKYPLKKIYQVDESMRSAHSNAYLYGFWNNKRMVLYDTLLATSHDKIVAVVGHELGHWKCGHTLKNFAISAANMLVIFLVFGFTLHSDPLYKSFGFTDIGHPAIIGLLLFSIIWSPLSLLTSLGMTMLCRRFEFQADAFAVSLGYGQPLREGLVELQKQNLSAMTVDKVYAWIHYSHPHLIERLAAIQAEEKRFSPAEGTYYYTAKQHQPPAQKHHQDEQHQQTELIRRKPNESSNNNHIHASSNNNNNEEEEAHEDTQMDGIDDDQGRKKNR